MSIEIIVDKIENNIKQVNLIIDLDLKRNKRLVKRNFEGIKQ